MKGFGKGSSSLEKSVLPHQDLTPRLVRGNNNGGVLEGNIKWFLMRVPAAVFLASELKYLGRMLERLEIHSKYETFLPLQI